MSLSKKSLTELRSIAQSIGIVPRFDIGKEHLIQEIQSGISAKVQQPQRPIEINIRDSSSHALITQAQIEEALEGFKELGLHLSFPDKDTWEITCNKKRDSGSLSIPLRAVIECAREIVRP